MFSVWIRVPPLLSFENTAKFLTRDILCGLTRAEWDELLLSQCLRRIFLVIMELFVGETFKFM